MTSRYRSKALGAVHETMSDLHDNGVVSDARMSEYDALCLAERPARRASPSLRFEIIKTTAGTWTWRLVTKTGRVFATSEQSYTSNEKALEAIKRVKAAEIDQSAA